MANKTSKMLEQKSKAEQHLNNSTIEEINGKLSKMQFENSKSLGKVETSLKEGMTEMKRQVEKIREDIDDKI